MKCTFPGCKKTDLALGQARVPAVSAIRAVIGKPVAVADLTAWILCGRHANLVQREFAKKEEGQTFSYVGTVALLERREEERKAAQAYSLRLRAQTQMGKAIAKALAPASAGSPSSNSAQPSQTRQPNPE